MFWHRLARPILHLPGLGAPILRRKVARTVTSAADLDKEIRLLLVPDGKPTHALLDRVETKNCREKNGRDDERDRNLLS